MAIAIQNCPFCGSSHNHINHHHMTFYVVCQHCMGAGPRRRSIDQSITDWNQLTQKLNQSEPAPPQSPQLNNDLASLEQILKRLSEIEHQLESNAVT